MADTTGAGQRRRWQLLTVIGFAATVCFTGISYLNTPAAETMRTGHPPPGLAVLDPDGAESTLDVEAGGFREILIVTPSCDECTDHLVDLVLAAEAGSVEASETIETTLFLLISSDLMPRADFMPAFNRVIELGARAVTISAEEAQKLGVFDLPVSVELDAGGRITAINYLWQQR